MLSLWTHPNKPKNRFSRCQVCRHKSRLLWHWLLRQSLPRAVQTLTDDELTAGSVYLRLTHLLTKPLRPFICEQWENSLWELKEMLTEIVWPKKFRLVIRTLNRAKNNLKRLYFYMLFPSIMYKKLWAQIWVMGCIPNKCLFFTQILS